VEPAYTAATLKSGLLEVLATPIMIAWMEECCMECVQPKLEEGFGTVGTLVNVTTKPPPLWAAKLPSTAFCGR
jgi:predicted thioesterase